MNKELEKFIEENKDLINAQEWTTVYENWDNRLRLLTGHSYIGEFTNMLLEIGIDPSEKMNYIPEEYLSHQPISEYVVRGNCKSVHSYAFESCPKLTKLIFLEGVEIIASRCIFNCHKLNKLVLPSTVKSIGYGCIQYCNSLHEIEYNGTKDEWTNITKQNLYIDSSVDIICLDGVIHSKR